MKKTNIFISLAFLTLLLLPLLDTAFNFSPIKQLFEKRIPAKPPKAPNSLSSLKSYPKNFEAFFNDNYGFRKSLITANSQLMDKVFNQSPSNRALIGKNGWLYFDNKKSFLDAQGLAKIEEKKLEKAADSFIKNWQNAKQNGVKYLVVIAADKINIYPEFLPNYIKHSNKNHRIDSFLRVLKSKSLNFPVLDLRPILKRAKKNEVIFHKTDTHWNRRGAHYGYASIMKRLGLKYDQRSKFKEIRGKDHIGDISSIMNLDAANVNYDLKAKFKRKWQVAKQKEFRKAAFFGNQDENLPVLFVYKDSFFDNMLYFFAQNFSKSYFVNEFPCELDFKLVKKYKADFVIQEFWENRVGDVVEKCL